jgi:hypothetical protein
MQLRETSTKQKALSAVDSILLKAPTSIPLDDAVQYLVQGTPPPKPLLKPERPS